MYGTVVALLGNHACKKSKQVTSQEWDVLRAYECDPRTGGLKGQLEALRSSQMEDGRKATKNNFLSKIQQCSGTAFTGIRGLNQLLSEQGMLNDYNCSESVLTSTLNTWCPNKSKIQNFLSDNSIFFSLRFILSFFYIILDPHSYLTGPVQKGWPFLSCNLAFIGTQAPQWRAAIPFK